MSGKAALHEIIEDEDYKRLVGKKDRMSVIMTILELVLYFGFIALIGFNKPFLARKLSESSAMTIGIPIAVGTILLSWIFTGIYTYWANNKYDVAVKKIREKIGG